MDHPHVGAGQLTVAAAGAVVDEGGADSQRVDRRHVQQFRRVGGRPQSDHRLAVAATHPLERHHDENRVLIRVGRGHRPLEQQRSALVVDLIVDEASQRLLAEDALGVLPGPRLDHDAVGAGANVRTELVGSRDAGAADLELLQALRGGAAEGVPDDRARGEPGRGAGECPLIAGQVEAASEVGGRDIAQGQPVEAALDAGGEHVLGGAEGARATGIAEQRVLSLLQRIVRSAEEVAARIEAAAVQAQSNRGALVQAAAGGKGAEGVGRGPQSEATHTGDHQRPHRRQDFQLDLAAQVGGAQHQHPATDFVARPQVDAQPARRIRAKLEAH